eukprot:2658568-Prymnesium_polylepis.1
MDLTELVSARMPDAVKALPEAERVAWVERALCEVHQQLQGGADGDEDEGAALDAEELAAAEEAQVEYRAMVLKGYGRLHPALFEPSSIGTFIEPALRAAVESGDDAALRALLLEESAGIYSLQLFNLECAPAGQRARVSARVWVSFCSRSRPPSWRQRLARRAAQECEHFEAWCAASGVHVKRPNTMNNYGAILDDFGMGGMMDAVMKQARRPHKRAAHLLCACAPPRSMCVAAPRTDRPNPHRSRSRSSTLIPTPCGCGARSTWSRSLAWRATPTSWAARRSRVTTRSSSRTRWARTSNSPSTSIRPTSRSCAQD